MTENLSFDFGDGGQPTNKINGPPARRLAKRVRKPAPVPTEEEIKVLRLTIKKLEEENRVLNVDAEELREYIMCLIAEKEVLKEDNELLLSRTASLGHSTATIPQDVLRRMINLCHPDKHDNSKMSNKITTWLMDQRRQ
jgi:regulator of replication initiation timing